ncbi:glycosyltransferase family A protein [Mesonia ostreae]|uniref:Glycosyltransferase family A protein n=1 Tax=Mesonia ostreae TaxID=861110 RepID=A0ABU2KH14_9FLAO|nr:glycosyltransferase family A protein [Mesonia ostreae]MDT0294002.1 glycosyltransferase family A protein [Mesonia ostreae]
MDIYIVIPAHNEAEFIEKTLQSLVEQTLLPKKIMLVNDNSSDDTEKIIFSYSQKYNFIEYINISSSEEHLPGSKVVKAFHKGLEKLDKHYDVICKFDADLIFPQNYLEKIKNMFTNNPDLGMAGGVCTISAQKGWRVESLTNKDHLRGALKAYKKDCFEKIGGLKHVMGWDTVDELLAQYHNFHIGVDQNLEVKHLRPTGKTYHVNARYKQGEAFYRMRYGVCITVIASLKLATKKNKFSLCLDYLKGFFIAKKKQIPYMVSSEEGKWIRAYRWKKIKEKLF